MSNVPNPLRKNYDLGEGFYGGPMKKFKSVKDFLKSRKNRKKAFLILKSSFTEKTFQSLAEAKQYANEYLEVENDYWFETFGNIIEIDKNNLQIRFHYYIGNGLDICQDFNITYLSHIEIKDNFEVIVHRKDLSSSEIKEIKAKTEEYVNNEVKEKKVGDRYYFDKDCYFTVNQDGTKSWYKKEKLHRLDGPAIEWADGSKYWFKEGKLHRLDGPAVECSYGYKEWYKEGKRHRLDGPARVWRNGDKEWWIEDVQYTKEGFNRKISQMKTASINKKAGRVKVEEYSQEINQIFELLKNKIKYINSHKIKKHPTQKIKSFKLIYQKKNENIVMNLIVCFKVDENDEIPAFSLYPYLVFNLAYKDEKELYNIIHHELTHFIEDALASAKKSYFQDLEKDEIESSNKSYEIDLSIDHNYMNSKVERRAFLNQIIVEIKNSPAALRTLKRAKDKPMTEILDYVLPYSTTWELYASEYDDDGNKRNPPITEYTRRYFYTEMAKVLQKIIEEMD